MGERNGVGGDRREGATCGEDVKCCGEHLLNAVEQTAEEDDDDVSNEVVGIGFR